MSCLSCCVHSSDKETIFVFSDLLLLSEQKMLANQQTILYLRGYIETQLGRLV